MKKPHELVSDYRFHPKFGEIAKHTAYLRKQGWEDWKILEAIKHEFGLPEKKLEMRNKTAPLRIIGEDLIEPQAKDQMYTSLRIPVALRGALMPDAHLGYALPIGGVILLNNAISPSYVGYDISCMMYLSFLNITQEEFEKHSDSITKALLKTTSFGLGAGFDTGERDHEVMYDQMWRWKPVNKYKSLAYSQLGSSGGGNHFADIVYFEDGGVGLLTHSGSRGTGHKLATDFVKIAEDYTRTVARGIPKEHSWLSLDTDKGKLYRDVMRLMGRYARANHELIHHHFSKESGIEIEHSMWNRHNYAWTDPSNRVLHRKGATPADLNTFGIIPGTCGSPAYLVKGLGNSNYLSSASHGAGRLRSRKASKEIFEQEVFTKHMQSKGIDYYGVAPDESPHAYKNIEDVIRVQEGVTVEVMQTMHPRVVVMGGSSDDGD